MIMNFLPACSQGVSTSIQKTAKKSSQSESVETMLEITDQKEKQAVLNAKAKVKAMSGEPRIVVTSPAVADICDKLDLDLVGVPKSSTSKIPSRYKKVKKVGLAMSPDMEIVYFLKSRLDLSSFFSGN